MKRGWAAALVVLVVVGGVAWFVRGRSRAPAGSTVEASSGAPREARRASDVRELEQTFPLNVPGKTIGDDVQLLAETFAQWQTNFPATGNPVGTNAEITAALCGDNALRLDLIPHRHPAINARGELCDRWGTPFRFHQQSGRDMEIISAGPDRDFATPDDISSRGEPPPP